MPGYAALGTVFFEHLASTEFDGLKGCDGFFDINGFGFIRNDF